MTQEQKEQAIRNAERSLSFRQEQAATIRRNSFESWGNDKCISRTMDSIKAMERGTASERQYRYWANQ